MLRKLWRNRHLRNRRGQGLTEYALLIALISLGLILALGRFRNALGNSVRNSTTVLNSNSVVAQEPVGGGGNNGNNNNGNNNNGNGNNNNGNNNNGNNNNGNNNNGNNNNNNGGCFFGFCN